MRIRVRRRHNYITADLDLLLHLCVLVRLHLLTHSTLPPLPTHSTLPTLPTLPTLSTHSTLSTYSTLPTLPTFPTLPPAHSHQTHLIAAAFERRHSIQGDTTLLKTDTLAFPFQESTPNKKGNFDEHSSLEDLIRKLATEGNIYFQADILNHMNNIW